MYYPVLFLLIVASSGIIFFSGCTNPFSKCTSCKENRPLEVSQSNTSPDKDSISLPDDLEADDDQDTSEPS